MAFYRLEPFGADADDWRTAQLLAMLVNVNRRRGMRRATAEDFMPDRTIKTEEVQQDVLVKRLDSLMASWGGVVKPIKE